MHKSRFISYLLGPALIGLAVAALLMVIFPEVRSGLMMDKIENAVMDLSENRHDDWSGPVSYSYAVQRAAPSVVNIYTRKKVANNRNNPILKNPLFRRLFNLQQQRIQSSLGSAVIMSSDGYMLTNHHVVAGADEITALLYDGREAPATVIGSDADTDLAVLHIEATNLQPITLGQPSQARIGDVVLAIGNPYGVGQSVTQGIISATGRNGLGLNTFENFIQTDADINPGNSGGALVDSYGNLLGISTAILNQSGSSGISFAIPADTAQHVLTSIIEQGHVIRGWIGFDASPLTAAIAKRFNLPMTHGLLIQRIYSGSSAHVADLLPGDIVISINDIAVRDGHSSSTQISDVEPGSPIKLGIWRNGETFTVTTVAGKRPQG